MAKVVVLMGSMRKGGNTDLLVKSFAEGAEKNNKVEIISVADVNVKGCTGCNYCFRNEENNCILKDDMKEVYSRMAEADIIAIATPVYFYGITSQLKAVIDRLHNPIRKHFQVKKLILLAVAADTGHAVFNGILTTYQLILEYFKLEDGGTIMVSEVDGKGDIKGNPALQEAYLLGESIK